VGKIVVLDFDPEPKKKIALELKKGKIDITEDVLYQ